MKTLGKPHILSALTGLIILTFSLPGYSQTSKGSRVAAQNKQILAGDFIRFFPDTNLAVIVAEKLNKKITDPTTTKELAGINGYFEVGPGEVSNLQGIGYLTSIDSFNCYKNEVTEIPAEFGNLTHLKSLDLCKAFSLKKIPAEIGKLEQLKYIRCCLTEITTIPKEIGNLSELETLLICCNSLTDIPKEIGNLKQLTELDIHSNILKTLPGEICNLVSLNSFDISHCGLEELPEDIGKLKALQTLNLFNNNLKYLPKSISLLDNLSSLNVFNNYKLSESYKKYLPKLLKRK